MTVDSRLTSACNCTERVLSYSMYIILHHVYSVAAPYPLSLVDPVRT